MSARTYQSVYVYLLKWVPRTYSREYAYLPKCLRVLTEVNTSYLFSWIWHSLSWCCRRRAPTGRYFFIAQGASPGLIVSSILWAPEERHSHDRTPTTTQTKRARWKCRSSGAHITFRFVCIQGFISGLPSFHPGLCRSIALTGLIYVFPITLLFWCGCY